VDGLNIKKIIAKFQSHKKGIIIRSTILIVALLFVIIINLPLGPLDKNDYIHNIEYPIRFAVKEDSSVDNDSNIDASINIGINDSTYVNVNAKDNTNQTIQEGNGAQYINPYDLEDFVDNVTDTDSGSNPDLGTYSDWTEMQNDDLVNNTLTEENTGGAGGSEWLDVNANDTTYTGWTFIGTQPYLDAQDQPTNIIETKSNGVIAGWYDFPATSGTGTLTVNISIYCQNDDGAADDWADPFVDYTGAGAGSDVGDVCQHTAWQYDTISLGTHSVAEVNALRVYFNYQKSGGADEVRIDHVRIGVSWAGGANYEFDRQIGWENANFSSLDGEVLAIRTGIIGTESLDIDVYDSGGWVNIATIVDANDNTWINTSVSSYLDSQYESFRFHGTSESGDTTENTWEISTAIIHTWTTEVKDYETSWEHQAQFISQGAGDQAYTLTVFAQSTETVDVRLWNYTDTVWESALFTITSTQQWYNYTVPLGVGYIQGGDNITWSYYDSDSGDSTQDTLYIDYAGIYTYSQDITLECNCTSLSLPSAGDIAFYENPQNLTLDSGIDYDVLIRGADGNGTVIADGWIFFDTDADPAGYQGLTTSFQTLYNDQTSATTDLDFWLWVNVPNGEPVLMYTITVYVRIQPA
jgi:hypothetical protein